MLAEFIDRPLSGQYPEKHFGETTPYSLWVKFTDKDFNEWVGSFTQGWEGNVTTIINFDKEERAFIVAGGDGYLFDTTNRQLINVVELSGIKTVIADELNQRIIFSEGLDIQCINHQGKHSILFDKYFFDEIEFMEVRDSILSARYWYYQRDGNPFYFEFNLLTGEVKDTYNEVSKIKS